MTAVKMLAEIELLLATELTPASAAGILRLLGVSLSDDFLRNVRLYSDTLPVGASLNPYTCSQRLLHFLWDAFDKTPYSLAVDLSIPFRRLIAKRLFLRCGERFICESNVTFNYGHQISVGNDVFFNRSIFIDSKGGVVIGDGVCLTEDVRIFSHGHSEAIHHERSYAPVVIGAYAKIYSGATVFPGISIGEEAIVASGALVASDVPSRMVVAGKPAKLIRERRSNGRHGRELEHIWLADEQFQVCTEVDQAFECHGGGNCSLPEQVH